MAIFGTIKAAKTVGVVTKGNSKIHGSTFSIDPRQCVNGAKLAKVKGSVCNKCYALKMGKIYPSAQKSWSDNLDLFNHHLASDSLDVWAEGIAFQIKKESERKAKKGISGAGYHRWFAAGDIQNIEMLRSIIHVANLTPNIKHWLPTKEAGIVRAYKNALGVIPNNLVIRVSAPMVDSRPVKAEATSTVYSKEGKAHGFTCPAYTTGGDCGECVACWDSKVMNVSYPLH